MGRTNDVRRYLDRMSAENGVKLHYNTAPDTAALPCLVYTLREVGFDGAVSQNWLEVNGFIAGEDDAALDELLDRLEGIFDRLLYVDNQMRISVYRQGTRQDVPEPEKHIKHKRILFELRFTGGI